MTDETERSETDERADDRDRQQAAQDAERATGVPRDRQIQRPERNR